MRKVFGIGETILDIIFKNNQPYRAVPGGSVFNGIMTLGRLNVPVTFIGELGNDKVGDIIQGFMRDNHIKTEYVDRFPDGKSPISLAFLDDQNSANYIFYKDYPKQRLEVPLPTIEKDDIFVFGSYYCLNPALRARVLEFIQYAKDRKAILYYDPNFRKAHAHEAIKVMPTVLENLEYADIVRGSDEDFMNLFKESDATSVYKNRIQFYCDYLLTTHGADGVNLYTNTFSEHFDVPALDPLSTIGAGDNFNAGIVYGLLKYDVRLADLPSLDRETWNKIIQCGIDLSAEVCLSYDNYVSKEFAANYIKNA